MLGLQGGVSVAGVRGWGAEVRGWSAEVRGWGPEVADDFAELTWSCKCKLGSWSRWLTKNVTRLTKSDVRAQILTSIMVLEVRELGIVPFLS
jgi:hypothetical protein